MGVLDKKIFSGVGIIAALLFIVAAVVGIASDDDYDAANYILLVAGVLAIIFSVPMFQGSSFVRKLCGLVLLIAGIVFIVIPFAGDSSYDVLGAAVIVTAIATLLEVLALWVSRVYGAMYIAVVLFAVEIVAGAMMFIDGDDVYAAVGVAFIGLWFILSSWVCGFVKGADETPKTREVVETPVSEKKDKPQAQNKKATPKAKPKTEAKPEPEPVKEEPKAEEPVKEEPVVEEAPAAEPEPVKVEPEPEPEPVKEEPKKEEIPPAKATGDFMQKLMSSKDAANAKPKVEKKEEPVVEEAPAAEPEPVKVEPEPEPVKVEPEPVPQAIEEPVQAKDESLFAADEPDWGDVSRDSSAPVEETVPIPRAVEEPKPAPVPVPEEEEEELGEDIYTDNSPEALVRRAAWNKGLRCRRNYGEMHIPVAFIKGHVAVFVQPKDADTSIDDKLRAEGWTVFRYDEATITDGLAQGEEIAVAVKANAKAAKKKSKK